jgi:hydroxyacylglutathione hydrolase
MDIQDQSRIIRIPLGRANAYFVIRERHVLLIDTGIKRNEQKIIQALGKQGLRPSDIRLIILTHTHYDHCGSLKALKDMTGAGMVVHYNEATSLTGGYGGFPRGTTRLTKAISWLGRTLGRRIGAYLPVSPDVTVSERFGLEEYGVDGYILPTPGHTAGSMSVIVHNRYAIVGDTLFNVFRKGVFPPFADDPEELLRSWEKLIDTGCRAFYPGHGNPFGIGRLRESLANEMKRRRSLRSDA